MYFPAEEWIENIQKIVAFYACWSNTRSSGIWTRKFGLRVVDKGTPFQIMFCITCVSEVYHKELLPASIVWIMPWFSWLCGDASFMVAFGLPFFISVFCSVPGLVALREVTRATFQSHPSHLFQTQSIITSHRLPQHILSLGHHWLGRMDRCIPNCHKTASCHHLYHCLLWLKLNPCQYTGQGHFHYQECAQAVYRQRPSHQSSQSRIAGTLVQKSMHRCIPCLLHNFLIVLQRPVSWHPLPPSPLCLTQISNWVQVSGFSKKFAERFIYNVLLKWQQMKCTSWYQDLNLALCSSCCKIWACACFILTFVLIRSRGM